MRSRWVAAGPAVGLLYVAVAFATSELSARPGRPLFDGFAPPVPYNWVKPPPELAAGNLTPQGAERSIAFDDGRSEEANASTPDAQILVTLPAGVVAGHPPDSSVNLRIAPRDAATLAPTPPDRRVVSNAYEVRFAYQPSQEPVTSVAANAQVALTAGSQGDGLLYSSDGVTWQQAAARPFGATHGMTGSFQGSGYYLVTASPAVTTTRVTTRPPGGDGGGGVGAAVAVGAGVVAVAAVAGGAYKLRSRRREEQRRARSRQQRRRNQRRR